MTHALFGTADFTQRLLELADPPFLLLDDGPIADAFAKQFKDARRFIHSYHHFNPLHGIDHKEARAFADAVYPDKDLMTYRHAKMAVAELLPKASRLDKLPHIEHKGDEDAHLTIRDLLQSPVLKKTLCRNPNFSFDGSIIAKLDRAALGDQDARILGTLLIGQYKGQVIVPDFGFYARDFYTSLIRQNRLIAGVRRLSELSDTLQEELLSVEHKTVYRVTRKDGELLADYFDIEINPGNLVGQRESAYRTTGGN